MSELFNIENKIVIVTGAGRGIGKSIVLAFVKAGAKVVLVSRTQSQLEEVAKNIPAEQHLIAPGDITQKEDIKKILQQTLDKWGRVDILVNNAGVTLKKPSIQFTEEEWQKIIDVNLTGVFKCAQIIGKQMLNQKQGSVINIASVGGHLALVDSVAYCSSKGGLLQMTKVLASEWGQYNVRVNAVSPGYVDTEFISGIMRDYPDLKEKIIQHTPMRRLAKPEEIVGAVLFLASDAASYINGTTITVDGGMSSVLF